MEGTTPKKKRISSGQFFISSVIGGPLMAGCMAAYNLWRTGDRKKAIAMILAGFILTLLLELTAALFARFVLVPLQMAINFGAKLIIIICFQLLFALLIWYLLKIKNLRAEIFPGDGTYYGNSMLIPLGLLSLVYLIVHIDIPILFAHFPNMILLFYLVPHLYFFKLAEGLFKSQKQTTIAQWVVLITASYMPLVFALDGVLPDAVLNFPLFLAEFYIYTLLYLFLLVRGTDLLLRLGLKLQLIPLTFIRSSGTKTVVILSVLIGLLVILTAGNKKFNRIVENEYFIQLKAKDAEIDALKICFVADMHLNNFTSEKFINDYIKKVSQINPDILLYGGDMIETGRISEEHLKEIDQKIGALKPVYGKYIVGGNHDRFSRNGYDESLDLTFLSDTVIKVANSFYLMGLKYRSFDEKPIHTLRQNCTEELPVILLDHSPYQLEAACKNDIAIQLSGHTHYGQVWPINYIIELMYDLPWGYQKINGTHFFVTSGIQGWGTPIRTVGQSEIMVIHVSFVN